MNYEEDFRRKYIPDHTLWSKNTLKGIEINFGLEDGDPNKPFSYLLGEDIANLLMAGSPGSGKSSVINQVLANVLYNYPPEWLELAMVDFKTTEFAKYTESTDTGEEICRCPHVKILASAESGEYVASIFNYLLNESNRRIKKFSIYRVSNIEEFNLRVMDGTIKNESIIPRILCAIEEYQEMFTLIRDSSRERITHSLYTLLKLSKAMGIHLWFSSSSIPSEMPKNILEQFKLRAALSCTSDISKQLIGNDDAAMDMSGKGWIYVNDSTGTTARKNRVWKVPFISDIETSNMLSRLTSLCVNKHALNRKATFFRENMLVPYSNLEMVYEISSKVQDPELFLLGNRTDYSEDKFPQYFWFSRQYGENAFVSASDTKSLLNLTKTILTNITCSSGRVIINCADNLMSDELSVLDNVQNEYLEFIPKLRNVKNFLERIKRYVLQETFVTDSKPLYVLCVEWDKYNFMFRDSNDYATQSLLREVVKISPNNNNVHFIFVTKNPIAFREIQPMLLHKIGAFMEEVKSVAFADSTLFSKTTETVGIYQNSEVIKKFKIYQYPREVKEEILVL